MLSTFLQQAAQDRPVYITDLREAFLAEGTRPLHIHLTCYDRTVRAFPLVLPAAERPEEAELIARFVHASVYNILSVLGGLRMDLYLDRADRELAALGEGLKLAFQEACPKGERTGYGKCLNVNERVLAALFQGRERFTFRIFDLCDEPAVSEPAQKFVPQPVFSQLPGRIEGRMLLGMDVGGTDVKLAVSVDGQLALCGELDWNPAAFTRAEELTGPLLLLARLARAAGSLWAMGRPEAVDRAALERGASPERMERGAQAMERSAGEGLRGFDAIGLSFPDVVIQNRIVGGESPKTRGMRGNPLLDYEGQFAKITGLNEALRAYTAPGGAVMCVNDGPMAAFTAAVERAAGGEDLSQGFFAHTLGTDLGSGWVRPDGSIPDVPLELYNCIIDLGSAAQRSFAPEDARSVNNVSTLLPGTLQKYASQSGVFRLAAKYLPGSAVFQEALDRGLFRWEGERLTVPAAPLDMRKECLEFLMDRAERQEDCAGMFREIGEYLAVACGETDWLLRPGTRARSLFGRLVKRPACFRLIREGAARRDPGLELLAADEALANTPLMKQLAARPDYTVAQFAQAVGAVYYGCLGL